MLKSARKPAGTLYWKSYERKSSIKLRSIPKIKKAKSESRRPKNRVALGIAALIFLIVLILLGKLFGFLGSINEPYSKDSQKTSSWNGESPLNLVVKADAVYLLSYQPKLKNLTILKFPDEIYLDLPYDFGRWSVRSIYDLGQAETPPMGARLLNDSIENTFDLISDGYIILDKNLLDFSGLIDKERANIVPGVDLLSNTKTNLNLAEYLKVWWLIKSVRSDKIKIIDLEKSDLTQWLLLSDGSRVVTLDPIKVNQFEEGRFEDANIKDEALSIGVFNATNHSGLAEKAAKIITNSGGRVIFTSNYPEIATKSSILAKRNYTSDYLSEVLRLACQPPKNSSIWQKIPLFGLNKPEVCSSGESDPDLSRADIIIILGEDSFLQYKK